MGRADPAGRTTPASRPAPADRFAGLDWSARHLLLLTATPHMGKDSPWHHLWRLLDPQIFSTAEALRRCPQPERDRHFIRRTKEVMVSLDGRPLYRERACDTFSYALSPARRASRRCTTSPPPTSAAYTTARWTTARRSGSR